jgi:hypothetical protein
VAPAGKYTGTVRFFNEDVGEFWYQLNLTALDPPPIKMEFVCEFGKSHLQTITIDNPSDQMVSNNLQSGLSTSVWSKIKINHKIFYIPLSSCFRASSVLYSVDNNRSLTLLFQTQVEWENSNPHCFRTKPVQLSPTSSSLYRISSNMRDIHDQLSNQLVLPASSSVDVGIQLIYYIRVV